MKLPLSTFSAEPRYLLEAVAAMTGIQKTLLLAWEERYAILKPRRTQHDQRLYAERDIATLWYVQQQMQTGQLIGHIAAELQRKRENNEVILVEVPPDNPL